MVWWPNEKLVPYTHIHKVIENWLDEGWLSAPIILLLQDGTSAVVAKGSQTSTEHFWGEVVQRYLCNAHPELSKLPNSFSKWQWAYLWWAQLVAPATPSLQWGGLPLRTDSPHEGHSEPFLCPQPTWPGPRRQRLKQDGSIPMSFDRPPARGHHSIYCKHLWSFARWHAPYIPPELSASSLLPVLWFWEFSYCQQIWLSLVE